MNPKIALIAFTETNDTHNAIVFQNWGTVNENLPDLVAYIELSPDDTTGLYNKLKNQFGITQLPTLVFAEQYQDNPQAYNPIIRIRDNFTFEGISKIYNEIINGMIPIPTIGNGGLIADSEGKIIGNSNENGGIGGGLFNLNLPNWLWGLSAIAGGVCSYRAERKIGKVAWGTVGSISLIKFFKTLK